jgi:hypothetical protein
MEQARRDLREELKENAQWILAGWAAGARAPVIIVQGCLYAQVYGVRTQSGAAWQV